MSDIEGSEARGSGGGARRVVMRVIPSGASEALLTLTAAHLVPHRLAQQVTRNGGLRQRAGGEHCAECSVCLPVGGAGVRRAVRGHILEAGGRQVLLPALPGDGKG